MKKLIKEYSIEDYRERYNNHQEFHIKVRLGCTDPITQKKDDCDIVYYLGHKAFALTTSICYEALDGSYWPNKKFYKGSDKKNLKTVPTYALNIEPNMYMFNATNMRNNQNNIKEIITSSRIKMSKYFNIIWDEIKLVPSGHYTKAEKIKEKEYEENIYPKALKKLRDELKEYVKVGYFLGYNEDNFLNDEHIKNIIDSFRSKQEYLFKVNFEHGLDDIPARVDLEYIFLNCCFFDGTEQRKWFKDFNTMFNTKVINNSDNGLLEDFEKDVKEFTNNYNQLTRIDVEKNYQHHFMICPFIKEKFGFKDNDIFYPFEEEYYTKESEKDSDGRGRIDNVFIKINEEKHIGEVYLIELKVNESVIDGTNGVHKHLKDIKELCSNPKGYDAFMKRLEVRVNYRRKMLNKIDTEIKLEPKINFFIVTAIMDGIEHAGKVYKLLYEDFENEDIIKQAIENMTSKQNKICDTKVTLPKGSKKLTLERQELEKLDKIKSVKFFFDTWDKNTNLTRNPFMDEETFKKANE